MKMTDEGSMEMDVLRALMKHIENLSRKFCLRICPIY